MNKTKQVKVKVWNLGWDGMEQIFISVDKFPKNVLKVDDWFGPQIGELCFNSKGKLDIVKDIFWYDGELKHLMNNRVKQYSFELSKDVCSEGLVHRVEVKRGKVFVFNGKAFVHQEALSGDYIDKIASKQPIIEILD